MRAALDAFAPHAVVVFRPEIVPAGAFADLRVPVARLPHRADHAHRNGRGAHPDLKRRRARPAPRSIRGNVDRIVSFDPLIVPTADEFMPVWRSLPIPVADRLFAPGAADRGAAADALRRALDAAPRAFLARTKAEFDCLHVAFGVAAAELERSCSHAPHRHQRPQRALSRRSRTACCLHLAAGHLVISETLSPTHGLEPGIDYLEVTRPEELHAHRLDLSLFPDAYHRVRVRGRRKAEDYRASTRVAAARGRPLRDLVAFGTHRAAAA